jgi:tRNA-specific 2-thiouridylase
MTVRALALFSGGLDSTLACRVVASQGIDVQAVRFVSPFFGSDLLEREADYRRQVKEKYGINVMLRDVSEQYVKMLVAPDHGYGKNFNPCIDCKILLLREACRMLPEIGASFIITGEVLGQRPMSQRRNTLRQIEKASGCQEFLVRPLCAKNLPPSRAEEKGLIDREKLLDFHGRGRQRQIALAAEFGITDYPAPAGGCSLTDPNLAARIREFYAKRGELRVTDARILIHGRHYELPGGGWLVIGRREKENLRLEKMTAPGDKLLHNVSRPGPLGILRFAGQKEDIELAAAILVRYSKKDPRNPAATVSVRTDDGGFEIEALRIDDAVCRTLMV